MRAIDVLWIAVHGAPRELITDSESGIVISDPAKEYCARRATSCTLVARASIPDASNAQEP
eukprot:3593139-Lingulodinium_polyedra.AAC.1